MPEHARSILGTWALLLLPAALVLGLKWPAVEAYWMATRNAPLAVAAPRPVLEVSRAYHDRVGDIRADILARAQWHGERAVRALNEFAFQTETRRRAEEVQSLSAALSAANARIATLESERDAAVAARLAAEAQAQPQVQPPALQGTRATAVGTRAAVAAPPAAAAPFAQPPGAAGEHVLFVGDSLMQGVAPHVRRVLCNRPESGCTDLSRPSSGLSQRWFHDWPRVVAEAFSRQRYTVMVVFLGANDPWDMIDGASRIRYGTEAWKSAYTERARRILRTAREAGARVFWVGLPNMQVPRLQEGSFLQNEIFARVVQEEGGVFIPTREVVGDGSDTFNRYVRLADGRVVAVRVDDGVHFTLAGQRLIAEAVLARLQPSAVATAQ